MVDVESISCLIPTSLSLNEDTLPNPLAGHARYEKVKDLGKGSHGFVLLANDKCTGERVAIKCLPRGLGGIEKVKRELLNHRQLWHAHVIQFYEVFLTAHHVCIVMEYAAGGHMWRYLSANILSEDGARFFFQQLIFAVRYCHHMKISNRDIKLENTLLDADNKVLKLCDFGLSKDESSECKTRVGTPNYLAPEIINMPKGATYDGKRADVWCCGVMLYAMLFRSFPFHRPEDRDLPKKDAMRKLIDRIVKAEWSVPAGETISEDCKDLLTGILQPEPSKRMTVEDIVQHPWYKSSLPDRAGNPDYPPRPEEGLQSVSSIMELLQQAMNDFDDVAAA